MTRIAEQSNETSELTLLTSKSIFRLSIHTAAHVRGYSVTKTDMLMRDCKCLYKMPRRRSSAWNIEEPKRDRVINSNIVHLVCLIIT